MKENVIQIKSYDFALAIVKMYQKYYSSAIERSLLRQILASGTSIGANVEEAEGGQSKRDFIAKMSIAYKEARETNYWLKILRDSSVISKSDAEKLIVDCSEILRIITAILNTSKRK